MKLSKLLMMKSLGWMKKNCSDQLKELSRYARDNSQTVDKSHREVHSRWAFVIFLPILSLTFGNILPNSTYSSSIATFLSCLPRPSSQFL